MLGFLSFSGKLGELLSANESPGLLAVVLARHSSGRRSKLPTVRLCKLPCCYVYHSFNVCEKIPDATELCYALLFI